MPARPPFDHIGELCRAVSSITRDMPSMWGGLASGCRVATVAVWAAGVQFLGAMETVNVLSRRLPQPVQITGHVDGRRGTTCAVKPRYMRAVHPEQHIELRPAASLGRQTAQGFGQSNRRSDYALMALEPGGRPAPSYSVCLRGPCRNRRATGRGVFRFTCTSGPQLRRYPPLTAFGRRSRLWLRVPAGAAAVKMRATPRA